MQMGELNFQNDGRSIDALLGIPSHTHNSLRHTTSPLLLAPPELHSPTQYSVIAGFGLSAASRPRSPPRPSQSLPTSPQVPPPKARHNASFPAPISFPESMSLFADGHTSHVSNGRFFAAPEAFEKTVATAMESILAKFLEMQSQQLIAIRQEVTSEHTQRSLLEARIKAIEKAQDLDVERQQRRLFESNLDETVVLEDTRSQDGRLTCLEGGSDMQRLHLAKLSQQLETLTSRVNKLEERWKEIDASQQVTSRLKPTKSVEFSKDTTGEILELRLSSVEARLKEAKDAFEKVESESASNRYMHSTESPKHDFTKGSATLIDVSADNCLIMEAGAKSIEGILREMYIFNRLSAWEISAIAGCCHRRNFKQGDIVFEEGDPGENFYIVESGSLRVLKNDDAICTLDAGCYFGKAALLMGTPQSATIEVADESGEDGAWLWELSKTDFSRFFNDPSMQPKIGMSMSAVNAEDIREMRDTFWCIMKALTGSADTEVGPDSGIGRRRGSSWVPTSLMNKRKKSVPAFAAMRRVSLTRQGY